MSQGLAPGSNAAAAYPPWYPAWARQLTEQYLSGTTCFFVLHGNTQDLFPAPVNDAPAYVSLPDFLATRVFGNWDLVLHYDVGRGLRPVAGANPARLQQMVQHLAGRIGDPTARPRDPANVLHLLDKLIERNLLEDKPQQRKSIGIVIDYAQYLAPAADLSATARSDAAHLVRLLSWAQNPYLRRVNTAFCLIADKLTQLNDRLVQSPYVSALALPLPDSAQRQAFLEYATGPAKAGAGADKTGADKTGGDKAGAISPTELTAQTAGLSLVNLQSIVAPRPNEAPGGEQKRFRELKKTLIERQCQGLVEFVEPQHKLDLVIGHEAAVAQLEQDGRWIAEGRLDAAPMGYLIAGSVGTGKTFLAECYAGSVGIPCVQLRNFRSKYVGETEGNLEQVLTVLRSLGPVVVIVDEADAALGNRQAEGDSGTSSRVFSMIASQMGDTKYRGKIVWMLLTCRPDLLPIDLKRQGRAEVHIPLFYPETAEEREKMFRAMAGKNKVRLPDGGLPELSTDRQWSGADIEGIVLSARRQALSAGRDQLAAEDLQRAIDEFIPSSQGLEKELQEIAAVLECTQRSFLTQAWRERLAQPDGRARLQERLVELRALIEQ